MKIKVKSIVNNLDTNVEEINISNSSVTGNNPKGKQCEFNKALALNNMLPPSIANMVNNQYIPNSQ